MVFRELRCQQLVLVVRLFRSSEVCAYVDKSALYLLELLSSPWDEGLQVLTGLLTSYKSNVGVQFICVSESSEDAVGLRPAFTTEEARSATVSSLSVDADSSH
jgi:hypothetical protein